MKKIKKLVRPHGDSCGCPLTEERSPGLGCPCPTTKLWVDPQGGKIKVKKSKTVEILVDIYNGLTEDSKWKLINNYMKNDMWTTLWQNKETMEFKESIGVNPPSDPFTIKIN